MLKIILGLVVSTQAFGAADPYTFLVFGDFGTGSADQYRTAETMKKVCATEGCDAALLLGDNFYPSGVRSVQDSLWQSAFEKPYAGLNFLFWAVLGNHDWLGNAKAEIDYSKVSARWRMPDYFYAVPNLPPYIHIFGLDTEKASQLQLEAARDHLCSKQGFKIIMGHHPIVSHGEHGPTRGLAKALSPVMKDCQVQIYLSGHDHHQEHIRTPWGYDQVIQGAGGKLRDVETVSGRKDQMGEQLFAASDLGFGIMQVTEAQLLMKFYGSAGTVIHQFSWSKRRQ